jgi:hypothetical protein
MKNEFIPYKQALALKELGFDEPCIGYYYNEKICFSSPGVNLTGPNEEQPLPLYQQCFRWFREKYQLHSTITSISQESWQWHITKPGESLGKLYDEDFHTYEEAELACLIKLIEIVKQKQ